MSAAASDVARAFVDLPASDALEHADVCAAKLMALTTSRLRTM
jgi:hypothetical protein